jgi:hypothetical protein
METLNIFIFKENGNFSDFLRASGDQSRAKFVFLGAEFGPQDSTPIIPTWLGSGMFARYPQHDLGEQDAFLVSRRFSPPKFKMLDISGIK